MGASRVIRGILSAMAVDINNRSAGSPCKRPGRCEAAKAISGVIAAILTPRNPKTFFDEALWICRHLTARAFTGTRQEADLPRGNRRQVEAMLLPCLVKRLFCRIGEGEPVRGEQDRACVQ